MDYIKLLNLQSEPFSNSPDPSFFYLSLTYQDCLQNLEISIRLRRGLNLVLGDIGIGKTTLSRALIQQFQTEADRFQFHLILDPSFKSENEFLYALIMGFGISRPSNNSLFAYKESIRQFLLDEGLQKGRVIVLIVDEGQKLNDVCLELLRDLLNFETNQFKLLQVIIMAQREFHEKIKERRNLTDRINTFYEIRPLDRNETQDMIRFRLQKAGWTKNRALFSPKAIDRIYHYSGGYPRRIITLCHHSLLFMLIRKADIVEPGMVEHAISQLYEYKEESNQTRNISISNTGIRHKSCKGFNWARLMSPLPLKRLISPVLSAVLILLLFLTLFWGTRNMNWSDPNSKSGTVKKSILTTKLRTQGPGAQGQGTQTLSTLKPVIQAPGASAQGTQEPDTQVPGASDQGQNAPDIQGFGAQTVNTQEIDAQAPDTGEPDTMKQDTRDLDMQSFPVHAFENKGRLDFNTDFSDISESILGKEIKKDHKGPDLETVSMIVSEGDTVLKLARRIYNVHIDMSIMKKIQQSNPHISNLNHIEVGERIFFPELLFSDKEGMSAESFVNP